jgi:hypothetical protein
MRREPLGGFCPWLVDARRLGFGVCDADAAREKKRGRDGPRKWLVDELNYLERSSGIVWEDGESSVHG